MKEKKPFSLLLLIFLLSGFCSYHIYYYCLNERNNQLVDKYYNKSIPVNNNLPQKVEKTDYEEDYFGILKIPKLKMELGFYNIDSKKNNVNQNIQLLRESVMPNILGGTIYLAAHSGDSYLGFFKNIDKLELNDEVIINYQKMDYHYTINNIFEMNKNGIITVNKNIHENYVVLTTCSKNKDKQLVITGKLFNKV